MGCLCSCFGVPDVNHEENLDRLNGSHNGLCARVDLFVKSLENKYEALFSRGGIQPGPSSNHGPISSQPTSTGSNTADSTSHSEPSPSNLSSGDSHLPPKVVVIGHEKVSIHSGLQPVPLSRSNVQSTTGGLKECCTEFPLKDLRVKQRSADEYVVYSLEEDEDECLICLEEYTPENPKIVTQCSHAYHLGCLYEWEQRSQTCPVCEKVMIFEEML